MAYTTIDDPSEYFDVTLWTGTGGARTISGLNHKPDLIWTKTRSVAYNHMWSDSSRGFNANSELGSNSTAVEGGLSADVYGYKSGHTSDGWTMVDGTDTVDGQEDGNTNQPSVTYVGWTWAANGGTTSSNTDGSITSTVQANTTAGFSIITYTGTGSTATIGHGLNSAPEIIITKGRSDSHSWLVGVTADSSDLSKVLVMNTTAASVTATSNYNAAPNSSTYQVVNAGGTNNNTDTYVAYVFHSVQGYSKIGSYTGNANANGPFVYTGFKPAWLLIKRTDSSGNWVLIDNKRDSFNQAGLDLNPDSSATENSSTSYYGMDLLSNGFKLRNSNPETNGSGGTYIYAAFAEHPFVSSEGVPTTAR